MKKEKIILILIYGIVIIGLFLLFQIELLMNGKGFFGDSQISETMLGPITFQLGILTAWMFNNNKPKT